MMSREDFVFTIGFDGALAVVDGKAKRQYGRFTTMELAEQGLYRAAFSSALWAVSKGDPAAEADMKAFIDFFNKAAGTSYGRAEELQRLFGVAIEAVAKTLVL